MILSLVRNTQQWSRRDFSCIALTGLNETMSRDGFYIFLYPKFWCIHTFRNIVAIATEFGLIQQDFYFEC